MWLSIYMSWLDHFSYPYLTQFCKLAPDLSSRDVWARAFSLDSSVSRCWVLLCCVQSVRGVRRGSGGYSVLEKYDTGSKMDIIWYCLAIVLSKLLPIFIPNWQQMSPWRCECGGGAECSIISCMWTLEHHNNMHSAEDQKMLNCQVLFTDISVIQSSFKSVN